MFPEYLNISKKKKRVVQCVQTQTRFIFARECKQGQGGGVVRAAGGGQTKERDKLRPPHPATPLLLARRSLAPLGHKQGDKHHGNAKHCHRRHRDIAATCITIKAC